MSEYVRLTPEEEEIGDVVVIYRKTPGEQHGIHLGRQKNGYVQRAHSHQLNLITTAELANIPWVKALIVTARKEVQDQSKGTERIKAWYEGTECEAAINNTLDYVGSSLRNDLEAALKPFEGVTYE